MRVLPFLALVACNPPPTNLGDAQTLTTTTLEAHLGTRVTVTGTPTPTRVVEHGAAKHTCRLFYLLGNRKLFVDDCSGSNCAGADPRCAELVEAQQELVEGTPPSDSPNSVSLSLSKGADSRVPELVEGTPSSRVPVEGTPDSRVPEPVEGTPSSRVPVEGTPDSRVPEPVEGTPSFTGRLMLFSTLPQATELSAYYRDHFGIKVVPGTTYVIVTDS